MSVSAEKLVNALSRHFPIEILEQLVSEYRVIKKQFYLGCYERSELNGGRFSECVLRLLQHLNGRPVTPLGSQLPNTNSIIGQTEQNASLADGVRLFVPKLVRVLLDVRNRRDVAHVGGDVSPNYADSLLVSHGADWIMTEIVRTYYDCSISEARDIVSSLNELHVPIVAEVNGFIRVQRTDLNTSDKVLVILYHFMPESVEAKDLAKWLRYGNLSRFRKLILKDLDKKALVHFEDDSCTLLPNGISYVDKRIPLELLT